MVKVGFAVYFKPSLFERLISKANVPIFFDTNIESNTQSCKSINPPENLTNFKPMKN
jgi:hypothetical protein